MITIPQVMEDRNAMKYYGITNGGFTRGMNSDPYAGNGFQIAQNVIRKNGLINKLSGDSLLHDFGDDVQPLKIEEYQKADGDFQILVWIKESGGAIKLRAIEEDGTVVTPSGGAGDLDWVQEQLSYEQISLTGYCASEGVSTVHTWDGTTLTSIATTSSFLYALGREGRSLTSLTGGNANFSRSDENPITSMSGGATVFTNGEYSPNISGSPVGIYSSSTGTLIAYNSGLELHQKNEYDDGSGIRAETRVKTFQYKGEGIDNKEKLTIGNYYIYLLTGKGIIQVDPVTGKQRNLLDEDDKDKSFRIREYFDLFDKQNVSLAYDPEQEMVIATMSTTGTGVNDICILYNEVNGDFYVRKGAYKTIGVVNRSVYAGSSVDGKVFRVFDSGTKSDAFGDILRTRLVSEWDAVSSMGRVTLPLDFFVFFSAVNTSSIILNLYVNGNTETPAMTISYNSEDIDDTSSLIGAYGNYTLGIGKSDDDSFADVYTKGQFLEPFHTYCWEIIEDSIEDFSLNDVVLEYGQLEEIPQTKTFSKSLFTI